MRVRRRTRRRREITLLPGGGFRFEDVAPKYGRPAGILFEIQQKAPDFWNGFSTSKEDPQVPWGLIRFPERPINLLPRVEMTSYSPVETAVGFRVPLGDKGDQLEVDFASRDDTGILGISFASERKRVRLLALDPDLASTPVQRDLIRDVAAGVDTAFKVGRRSSAGEAILAGVGTVVLRQGLREILRAIL